MQCNRAVQRSANHKGQVPGSQRQLPQFQAAAVAAAAAAAVVVAAAAYRVRQIKSGISESVNLILVGRRNPAR